MIGDVSRAVRGLLAPLLPAGAEVRFGALGGESAPDGALVWVLADVREDEKAAETDWTDIRDDTGRVVARRPPVRQSRRLRWRRRSCSARAAVSPMPAICALKMSGSEGIWLPPGRLESMRESAAEFPTRGLSLSSGARSAKTLPAAPNRRGASPLAPAATEGELRTST